MAFNRLLVIDDEPEVAATVGRVARRTGFDTIITTEAVDFLDRVASWSPTVVILDLMLPDIDGLKILDALAEQRCGAHILIVSGHERATIDQATTIGRVLGLNMAGVLQKPLSVEALGEALRTIYDDEALISADEALKAVQDGDFFLEYQPIVRLGDARPVGVEALARWRHRQRGVIYPDSFISVMESAGIMRVFTPMVLDMAIRQTRIWRDEGVDLGVSVNVSGGCIGGLALDDIIARGCAAHGVSPSSLTVEITETSAMVDLGRAAIGMANLRALGVRLSIDDFGTGYSSLVQLHRLPFSEIKIDKSFVLGCDTHGESQIIVKAIISLAQNFSLDVVAEGVETEAIRACVAAAGCEMGQGYLFSRPLPAERVAGWRHPQGNS